jgi:hypothetical protein
MAQDAATTFESLREHLAAKLDACLDGGGLEALAALRRELIRDSLRGRFR